MKTICLYFEIHQIIHLKRYRFFEIGSEHYYYDDYANEQGMNEVAERSYIPALRTLIDMAKANNGAFRVALSISGVALEQLEIHAPAVIELLHELNATGCCEFLCEPYSHGLSSLKNETCFCEEVERMRVKIKDYFGQDPKVFRNSSLIYDNEIGGIVAGMGFKGMLAEGAKHVLGWKSPHYLYHCAENPNLKLLLRDFKLSDDISLRFSNTEWSEYPLFADKYIGWIASLPENEQVINIFMELSALGIFQPDYHKAFQIPVIEGNVFTPTLTDTLSQQVMVSRQFVERMKMLAGWTGSPIGKPVYITEHRTMATICGVYEDIHLGSQVMEEYDERPTVMFYRNKPSSNLYVALNRMSPEAMKEVQQVIDRTISSQQLKVYSLSLEMGNLYNAVLHVRNSVLFAGLCILIIALTGLVAYVRDEVSRRRSEIAIRLIHGASMADVQKIFLLDLLKIALPAVVIGALCAWKVGEQLLQLFAVKINLTWYLFAGCILIVCLVVWLVAFGMVWKAARANPTENLKTE